MKHWIAAFRLRTLPLALACTGMGSILAAYREMFRWEIALLTLLTATFLQVLSNLANDYGDHKHGVDADHREGPKRMVQSGHISDKAMKKAIYVFSVLSFFSGLLLILLAFDSWVEIGLFLGIGLLAIIAAIAYTNGKRPYGYVGLGDISVFIFFGAVSVLGAEYLHHSAIYWLDLLPASSCGLFATAVLNVNNIRDIESDKQSGKYSIPVRLGRAKAKMYHYALILGGLACSLAYGIILFQRPVEFLFVLSVPLLFKNMAGVAKGTNSQQLDPYLKQMAISTLFFVVSFGIGVLV